MEFPGARELVTELDAAIPLIVDYGDSMRHALDDRLDRVAFTGDRAARGTLVDAAEHDALEDFCARLLALLSPYGSGSAEGVKEQVLAERPHD
jgi:hypothetical protein